MDSQGFTQAMDEMFRVMKNLILIGLLTALVIGGVIGIAITLAIGTLSGCIHDSDKQQTTNNQYI